MTETCHILIWFLWFQVWITEFGKWDLKKVFEGGEEILKEFDHYVDQLIVNVLESLQLESHKNNEDAPGEVVAVIDMDGYNLAQLASVPSKLQSKLAHWI